MFLSVSIDLVGSTAIKRAISRDRHGDYASINAIYERYAEIMFDVEGDLYASIAASEVLDIRELFLVKIIGDEYWFLYEVNEDEPERLEAIATSLIATLLDVFSEDRRFEMTDTQGTPCHFDLSTKALVDLLTNALHLPQRRFSFFENKIMHLLGSEHQAMHLDPSDYAAVCYGLNLRPQRPPSKELLGVTRSDYVGVQVDRFFRTTTACKPRLVTVGETLWDQLSLSHVPVKPGTAIQTVSSPNSNSLESGCSGACETIPASQMQGINMDYTVWHLFRDDTLRDEIYAPDIEATDFLDPTRAFLARSGFYGMGRSESD